MTRADMRETLIQNGFDRKFIEGLDGGIVAGLYSAWDWEDPDEQFDRIDTYLSEQHIDADIEEIYW